MLATTNNLLKTKIILDQFFINYKTNNYAKLKICNIYYKNYIIIIIIIYYFLLLLLILIFFNKLIIKIFYIKLQI